MQSKLSCAIRCAATPAKVHRLQALRIGSRAALSSAQPAVCHRSDSTCSCPNPTPRLATFPRRPDLSAPRAVRRYHSYDHPPPPGPYNDAERAILSAAYSHVPTQGFTASALAQGARDAGYLDISANILPDGVFSLIQYHLSENRAALASRAEELAADTSLSVLEKAELLTWSRLQANEPVIGQLQEALAIMAQPSYGPASVKELAMLADEIWFLAGDVAVDPSWYTKRGSLSAIYAAAELFMTTDKSAGFRDTRDFLRRRFSEVNELGSMVRSVSQWVGFSAGAAMNVLRSKGLRV